MSLHLHNNFTVAQPEALVMTTRNKTETIQQFITENVDNNPNNILGVVSELFGITRQAASHHIQTMLKSRVLVATGNGRARTFALAHKQYKYTFKVNTKLNEHDVWTKAVVPHLVDLRENVREILAYSCAEMINNIIDHSRTKKFDIIVEFSSDTITVSIRDYGVGIFRKIQQKLQLPFPQQAVLELAKGKFTTDPKRHSGEGIFFTSRMVDDFRIQSGGLVFSSQKNGRVDLAESVDLKGTSVFLKIKKNSRRTSKKVFDQYSVKPEESTFDRTYVPVQLAKFGDEFLVSRSQAKLLLTRFERFKEVVLDFTGVSSLGQAFADEIFRVFSIAHPDVSLTVVNVNSQVQQMINRAKRHY